MSKQRSQSGPCIVVGHAPPIVLTAAQQESVRITKATILANKAHDRALYAELSPKLKLRRRNRL